MRNSDYVCFVSGNLLDSAMQTLVNTVNCKGVMGKGIALEFKKRYPEMFDDYVSRCDRLEVVTGEPYLYTETDGGTQLSPFDDASKKTHHSIINFPTKKHWRSPSRLEYVTDGLSYLLENMKSWNIHSLAVPPLGCGNGGLDWCLVGPKISEFAEALNIQVEIYVPPGVNPEAPFQLCH